MALGSLHQTADSHWLIYSTCMCAKLLQLSPALCDPMVCQAPLSMRFLRQEYWNGLPCSPPGDLPDPGIEPASLMSPALAGGFFTTSATWEILYLHMVMYMLQCYSLKPSHPLLPSPCPKVCSVCLCRLCCPENRVISTIFLDAIYTC